MPKSTFQIIPIDLLFGRFLTNITNKNVKMKLYKQLCPLQTNKDKSNPDMYYELDNDESIREVITDNYHPFIRLGKITPKKGNIKKFFKNGVIFDDESIEVADVVLFCTGYKSDISYLDEKILLKLKFEPTNRKHPVILYRQTIHPDVENFAMIGFMKNLSFSGIENQANWVAKHFTNQINLPTRDLIEVDMNQHEYNRKNDTNNEYPYGVYNKFVDILAKDVNSLPDFDKIYQENSEIYRMLWNNGTIPSHFAYNNDKTREISLKILKQVDELTKKQYILSDNDLLNGYFNGDYLPTFKLASQFSKNYKIPMHLFKDWEEELVFSIDKEVGFKLIKGFDHFDQDKNGYIAYDELPDLLKWIDIDEISDDDFKIIDANNDGKITLCEFLDFAGKLIAIGTHKKRVDDE
jgi:hypothetical protein